MTLTENIEKQMEISAKLMWITMALDRGLNFQPHDSKDERVAAVASRAMQPFLMDAKNKLEKELDRLKSIPFYLPEEDK